MVLYYNKELAICTANGNFDFVVDVALAKKITENL